MSAYRETEAGRKGGTVARTHPYAGSVRSETVETIDAGEVGYLGLNRTAWPAIWAAFFIGTMCYVLLSILGIAIGLSWANGGAAQGNLQTAAGIWFIATGLISFFIGGVVAGKMSAVPGKNTGSMNGLIFGCFSILLLLALMATPVVQAIPSLAVAFNRMGGLPVNSALSGSVNAGQAQAAAWWTLLGLVVALGAAACGGAAGARAAAVDPLRTEEE